MVSGVVTEAVVDNLEPIEIDEKHGDEDPRAATGVQRVLAPIEEEQTVRQASQRIMRGLMSKLGVRRVALETDAGESRRRAQHLQRVFIRFGWSGGIEHEQHCR